MADDRYRRGELPGQQQDVVLQWGEPADGRLAVLLVYLVMQQVNYQLLVMALSTIYLSRYSLAIN
jgi:hypothetical protein